jgi:hypothetical protein
MRPLCECCGETASHQDRDGIWFCEEDWWHDREHHPEPNVGQQEGFPHDPPFSISI